MYFKPIDEMSLRHLFSSSLGEEVLKMSYLGPVLDAAGNYQTSPDCLILDKRKEEFRIWRCEFKHSPSGKERFEQNGQFDIAVVWSLPSAVDKQKLLHELSEQNGCHEIVLLSEFKVFSDLPEYHIPDAHEFNRIDELTSVLLGRRISTVYAAYVAARIYPTMFHMDMMVETLLKRFPELKKMRRRGRPNVVSALLQTDPPLLRSMHRRCYLWNDDINPKRAVTEIGRVMETGFGQDIPDDATIQRFYHATVC
jgi:hypothetical protein